MSLCLTGKIAEIDCCKLRKSRVIDSCDVEGQWNHTEGILPQRFEVGLDVMEQLFLTTELLSKFEMIMSKLNRFGSGFNPAKCSQLLPFHLLGNAAVRNSLNIKIVED